ncbi:histidine kinase cki1 [Phtheirospermum japonicum]|uniref:histidine kinase n=1 Tax=Phtheirospermum japonicum TaxID=374723 RepID=A0A830B037_9LAMI|nr:histidine kinase cki1 [Phtheirospermum japonicum]
MLLVLVLAMVVVSVSAFVFLVIRYTRREMLLCAALVKQMDSTQQAERKSMNKSLAFASASHDIRASLAAITGLIYLCREDSKLDSNLSANLAQMDNCAMDLLGILNSVLDPSKIEAGKMQLEEEKFNVSQLLEDVVDMFSPIGMKKGVDVVLDPCDGSCLKFSLVRGDRVKLKQVLCNLLSNATKFTSDGHISVRAMVRKTSIENAIIASNRTSVLKYCLSRMCHKNKGNLSTSLEGLHTVQDQNSNSMEYMFEVDDTGKGIPKERQQSVFEDFVQVKETAHGQLGTGLGLGIVQSLVRLMGGEIKIMDKEQGEKGTCFRFNVFLTAYHPAEGDTDEQLSYMNDTDIHRHFGMHFRSLPPRSDASHVVLFLAGEERGKISKRLLRSLGVKVLVVKRTVDFFHALERIKQTIEDPTQINSSSEICVVDTLHKSPSHHSSDGLSSSDPKGELSSPILVVIDSNAAPVSELSPILASFRKEVQNVRCKFVWFENPVRRNEEPEDEKTMTRLCDHVLTRPLHGSHLYRVLCLLPEFGGVFQTNLNPIGKSQCQTVEVKTVQVPKNEGGQKPLNGKNILVVEDDITLCMLSTKLLSKLGATIHVCKNGKEALDLVSETLIYKMEGGLLFDYIFMDCRVSTTYYYNSFYFFKNYFKAKLRVI